MTAVWGGCECRCCEGSKVVQLLRAEGGKTPALLLDAPEEVEPPQWFDALKFRRGQQFFRLNFLSVFISNLVGLVCILHLPGSLTVLVRTDRSSNALTAFKRYLSTLRHLYLWYTSDPFKPGDKANKSIKLIRKFHLAAICDHDEKHKEEKGNLSKITKQSTKFSGTLPVHDSHEKQLENIEESRRNRITHKSDDDIFCIADQVDHGSRRAKKADSATCPFVASQVSSQIETTASELMSQENVGSYTKLDNQVDTEASKLVSQVDDTKTTQFANQVNATIRDELVTQATANTITKLANQATMITAQLATQVDMVATQWAFCGLVVTRWKELGIAESSLHLMDDFMHFWATIGYLMGIQDRFNICLAVDNCSSTAAASGPSVSNANKNYTTSATQNTTVATTSDNHLLEYKCINNIDHLTTNNGSAANSYNPYVKDSLSTTDHNHHATSSAIGGNVGKWSASEALVHQLVLPNIDAADPTARRMIDALLNGAQKIVPVVDCGVFWCFTLRLLGRGQDALRCEAGLTRYQTALLAFQVYFLGSVLHWPVLSSPARCFANLLMAFGVNFADDVTVGGAVRALLKVLQMFQPVLQVGRLVLQMGQAVLQNSFAVLQMGWVISIVLGCLCVRWFWG